MNIVSMRQRSIVAALTFTLLLLMGSLPAVAQVNATVKGKAVDSQGKPIAGATVQMVNVDNGRKFKMKTDKKGEFLNIGIAPGKYSATLTGEDGKVLSKVDNFPVDPSQEVNELDFNIQAEQQETQAIVSGQKKVEPNKMTEEQRKALEEAQKKMEAAKAANVKIGSLNTLLKQARADITAKDFPGAIAAMNQGIQVDPSQPLLYGTLGEAQSDAKDYKSCAESLTKAIELQTATNKPAPQITSRWNTNLAMCQIHNGDLDGAKATFDKAAQEDPTYAGTVYYNEGALLTNLGKTEDANAAFDKAIAADPTKADAYYQKGINLVAKATTDKAGKVVPAPGTTAALEKYLELAPDGPNADAAKQILESMGEKVATTYSKGKKK
ncbi:MAG: carboxypeptidase regulatory-like domain-containing protein [Acidobacteriaceae bacterium]